MMFTKNGKGSRITNITLKKKAGELILHDFKTQYKATIKKTAWFWPKNKDMYKQIQMKNPEIDPQKYR